MSTSYQISTAYQRSLVYPSLDIQLSVMRDVVGKLNTSSDLELWKELIRYDVILPLLADTHVLFTGEMDRGWCTQHYNERPCIIVWDEHQQWLNWGKRWDNGEDWKSLAPPDNSREDFIRCVTKIVAWPKHIADAISQKNN
jgi:hypothetical protein